MTDEKKAASPLPFDQTTAWSTSHYRGRAHAIIDAPDIGGVRNTTDMLASLEAASRAARRSGAEGEPFTGHPRCPATTPIGTDLETCELAAGHGGDHRFRRRDP